VLASCLSARSEQPEAALLAYEEKRKARAAKVLAAARSNMGVFHRSNIVTQLATYGPMRIADKLMPAFVRSRLDWIYAYDASRA
jgi:salicylate hydroxylase